MQFQLKNGQMFDTTCPACPTCGGEMWDNSQNKKFPSAPDFRCKNKACVDEKGRVTGVYIPKAKGPAPAQPAPRPPVPTQNNRPVPPVNQPLAPVKPTPVPPAKPTGKGDYGNSVPPSMFGAWAMNLVVALVGQGKITTVAEGMVAYNEALKGVGAAVEANKCNMDAKLPSADRQVPVAPAKPVVSQAPAPAPTQAPAPVTSPEQMPDPVDAVSEGIDEISMEDLSSIDLDLNGNM